MGQQDQSRKGRLILMPHSHVSCLVHLVFSTSFPWLFRGGLHGKCLLVNTGLNLRDRAIIHRHLFRLSLEHEAMAHP